LIPNELIADSNETLRHVAENIQKLPHIDTETDGKKQIQVAREGVIELPTPGNLVLVNVQF